MKTKIKVTLLILSLFAINTVLAITPSSIHDRESFLVTTVDHLARSSKITGIYDSFPVTGASILITFNQIDRAKLNDNEKSLYDKVETELYSDDYLVKTDDGFAANFEMPITLEKNYYKTSDGRKLKRYELLNQYKDIAPCVDFRSQLYFGDNLYGYSQFAIKDNLNYSLTHDAPNKSDNLRSIGFFLNDGSDFETHQPYKVGLSLGDEHYNFQVGRNRLSTGSGVSGNFFIGDNFSKQDYASFSLLSPIVSYTVSMTLFDQQTDSLNFDKISFNGMQQYRVMHKAKINLFKNLSLDVYQGALFQVDSFNFRMVIPFMYVHNYFNFADRVDVSGNDEANNVLGIQTKWVFSKGQEINLILSFDQIQLNESADVFPQAYGLLANYKTTRILKKGILSEAFEAAYTSPYLYLNEKKVNGETSYNYDHIYGNHYRDFDEIGYGGYYYGPDTLMLAYYINYFNLNNWNLGANLSLRVHGTKGIKTLPIYEDTITDTISNDFIVGTPEYIIQFIPNFSFPLTKLLTIKGSLGFSGIINHYHDFSSPLFFNVQGKISAQINIV